MVFLLLFNNIIRYISKERYDNAIGFMCHFLFKFANEHLTDMRRKGEKKNNVKVKDL